jgi:hypothetical protein
MQCLRSVRAWAFGLTVSAAFASIGCGEGDDETIQDAITVENALTANALTANALTANALTANALTANALTANALTANALTANALTANGLRDPLGREFLKYVVSCALDEDDSVSVRVDGKKYEFPGSLGLAPDWGKSHGTCDGECQRWVSACVLARVDAAGIKRLISIRGDHPALRPEDKELRRYTDREATYYGNVFLRNQPRYLCLSPGKTSDERVCGDSLRDCPMTVVGSCDDACADEGNYRAFEDCSDRGRARRGTVYHESIKVFLPKSQM